MAIANGSTATITWRTDGATIAFTPAGGSVVTFSVALDRVGRALEKMISDDLRSGSALTSINNLISATTQTRGGAKHIEC